LETQMQYEEQWKLDWKSRSEFEDYNGWTNRETWAANLWYGDDQQIHGIVGRELAQTFKDYLDPLMKFTLSRLVYEVSERLVFIYDEYLAYPIFHGAVDKPLPCGKFYVASAGMALSDIGSHWRVEWREIAEHYVDAFLEQQAIDEQ